MISGHEIVVQCSLMSPSAVRSSTPEVGSRNATPFLVTCIRHSFHSVACCYMIALKKPTFGHHSSPVASPNNKNGWTNRNSAVPCILERVMEPVTYVRSSTPKRPRLGHTRRPHAATCHICMTSHTPPTFLHQDRLSLLNQEAYRCSKIPACTSHIPISTRY